MFVTKRLAILLTLAAGPVHAQQLTQGGVTWLGPDQLAEFAPPPVNPPAFQSELAEAVLLAANERRAQVGLPLLVADRALAQAAGATVTQMRDGLPHEPLSKKVSPAAAEDFAKIGENLWSAQGALDWRAETLAENAAAKWSERRNLMDGGFTQAGVATVVTGDRVYVAMVLAEPRNGFTSQPAFVGSPISTALAAPAPAPAIPLGAAPLAPAYTPMPLSSPAPAMAALPTTAIPATVATVQSVAPPDLYTAVRALPGDLLASLNTERAQQSLSALYVDASLSRLAQQHSEGLIDTRAFGPTGADGVPVLDRAMAAASGALSRVSVGLWRGSLDQPLTARILGTWRQDQESRGNMLDPRFDRIGVGVAGQGEEAVVTILYGQTS